LPLCDPLHVVQLGMIMFKLAVHDSASVQEFHLPGIQKLTSNVLRKANRYSQQAYKNTKDKIEGLYCKLIVSLSVLYRQKELMGSDTHYYDRLMLELRAEAQYFIRHAQQQKRQSAA
jgi:hypothetical protein